MAKKQITENVDVGTISKFDKFLANYNADRKLSFADTVAADKELAGIIDYAATHNFSIARTYAALKDEYGDDKMKTLENFKKYFGDRKKKLAAVAAGVDLKAANADLLKQIDLLNLELQNNSAAIATYTEFDPLIEWAKKKATINNIPINEFITAVMRRNSAT